VHKKYIKKNGKVFGPYYYETKRVDGRVVTTYVGPVNKNENKLFWRIFVIVLIMGLLWLFFVMPSFVNEEVSLDKILEGSKIGRILFIPVNFLESFGLFGGGIDEDLIQFSPSDQLIEGDAHNLLNARTSSRFLVWVDELTGYVFFLDGSGSDFSYSKTIDGGDNWGGQIVIDGDHTRIFSIWYDRWTQGDLGTNIHIVWIESTGNDMRYNSLDTSNDLFGGETIIFDGSTIEGFNHASGMLSIVKANGGNLYTGGWLDDDGEYTFQKCTGTCNSGGNWEVRENVADGIVSDRLLLVPGNEAQQNDILAIYLDRLNDILKVKTYDDDGDANGVWSENTISGSMSVSNAAAYFQIDAAPRHSDGHTIVAMWSELDSATADLRVWDVDSGGSISEMLDGGNPILLDTSEAAQVGLLIDQNTDDVYLTYLKGVNFQSNDVDIKFRKYDAGTSSWDIETLFSGTFTPPQTNENKKLVSAGTSVGSDGGRFMPVWFEDNNNEIYTNDVNDIELLASGDAFPVIDFGGGTPPSSPPDVTNDFFTVDLTSSDDNVPHYAFLNFDSDEILAGLQGDVRMWMRMEGDVTDESGYVNHGTLMGGATILTDGGQFGDSLQLDGNNNYVLINTPNNMDVGTITVSLWAKSNKLGSAYTSSGQIFHRKMTDAGTTSLLYKKNPSPPDYFQFQIRLEGSEGTIREIFSDGDLVDTDWHHYVGTYDGTTMKMYVDGVLQSQTLSISGLIDQDNPDTLTIGSHANIDRFWDGLIDDIIVFERALTDQEVKALFNAGAVGNQYLRQFTNLANGDYDFTGFAVDMLGQKSETTPSRSVTVNVPVSDEIKFSDYEAGDIDMCPLGETRFALVWCQDEADPNDVCKIAVFDTDGTLVDDDILNSDAERYSRVAISCISSTEMLVARIDAGDDDLDVAKYLFSGSVLTLDIDPINYPNGWVEIDSVMATGGDYFDVAVTILDGTYGWVAKTDFQENEYSANKITLSTLAISSDFQPDTDISGSADTPWDNNADGCAYSSNRIVGCWHDAGSSTDDMNSYVFNENGGQFISAYDIDSEIGDNGAISCDCMRDDRVVFTYFDSTGDTVEIDVEDYTSGNTGNLIGNTPIESFGSLTSTQENDMRVSSAEIENSGSSYFGALYTDTVNNDVKVGIYDDAGTQITEPFVVTTDHSTNSLYKIVDIVGGQSNVGLNLCNRKFVTAYTKDDGSAYFKMFDVAGNIWDGTCIGDSFPTISFSGMTPLQGVPDINPVTIEMTSSDDNVPHYVILDLDNDPTPSNFQGDLVMWLRMEDNVGGITSDDSPDADYDNDGTLQGSTLPTVVNPAKFGKGFHFVRADNEDKIVVADHSSLEVGNDFTVAAWVKTSCNPSTTSECRIIQRGAGPQEFTHFLLDLDEYTYGGTNDDATHFCVNLNGGQTSGCVDVRKLTIDIFDNQWHLIAGTWDGTTISLYIDNNAPITKSYSDSLGAVSGNIYVGSRGDGANEDYFDGDIDEVMLFDRALTANEILSLYDASTSQYSQQFSLVEGDYMIEGRAVDSSGQISSDSREISITQSSVTFDEPPTPINGVETRINFVEVQADIITSDLQHGNYSWYQERYSFDLDGSLVGLWNFNDGFANDMSGKGNDGTPFGGVAVSDGKVEKGFLFDGTEGTSVRVDDSSSLFNDNIYSISAWINLNAMPPSGGYSQIFSNTEYVFQVKYISPTTVRLKSYENHQITSPDDRSYDGSVVFDYTSGWHHVVITNDGVTRQLYLDGVPDGATGISKTITSTGDELRIGDSPLGSDREFNGRIDEVRFWKKALTAENVFEIYERENHTRFSYYDDNLILMYNFDNVVTLGESSSLVKDLSGNGYDGTVNPGATIDAGKYNGGYDFAGTGTNGASISVADIAESQDFTISAWFKYDSIGSGAISEIIANGEYYLQIDDEPGGVKLKGFDYGNPGINILGDLYLSPGVWYHGAFVNDDSNRYLYLNGQLDKSDSLGGNSIPVSTDLLKIGDNSDTPTPLGGREFDGDIDEVRVWNRALNHREIEEQYKSNLNKYDVMNWKFYMTQSNFSLGNYSYQATAGNTGLTIMAGPRSVMYDLPFFKFIEPPTPVDFAEIFESNAEVLVSVTTNNLRYGNYTCFQSAKDYDGDLIGHWSFNDGSADDISGNGYHGTYAGAAKSVEGKVMNGSFYDGVTGTHVSLGNVNDMNPGTEDFSVSAWIQMQSGAAVDTSIFSKQEGNNINNYFGWNFWIDSDTTPGAIEMNVQGIGDPTRGKITGNTDLIDGLWHHVTFVKIGSDRTDWKLYVDGDDECDPVACPEGGPADIFGDITTTVEARIGSRFATPVLVFDGTIDEVKYWNRALTVDEVQEMYLKENRTRFSYFDESLILALNLNNDADIGENSGLVVDHSIWSNNGTVINQAAPHVDSPDDVIVNGNYGDSYEFCVGWTTAQQCIDDDSLGPTNTPDYIEVLHNSEFFIPEGTVSLWFYTKDSSLDQSLFSKDANQQVSGGHFTIGISSFNGQPLNSVNVRLQDTINDNFANTGSNTIVANKWYNVITSFGSDGMKTYLDGKLMASNSYTGGLDTSGGGAGNMESITIGAGSTDRTVGVNPADVLTRTFWGFIDEVRMWNYQMSASEINFTYHSNMRRYDINSWDLYVNKSSLGFGTYNYKVSANDFDTGMDMTSLRTLTVGRELRIEDILTISPKNVVPGALLNVPITVDVFSLGGQGEIGVVSANFTSPDPDGAGPLMPTVRVDNGCTYDSEQSLNVFRYDCDIDLQYYDIAGEWEVFAHVCRNGAPACEGGEDGIDHHNYGGFYELPEETFVLGTTYYINHLPSFDWGNLDSGTQPNVFVSMLLKNWANGGPFTTISLRGNDLTKGADSIPIGGFYFDYGGGTPESCNTGIATKMTSTAITVGGLTLPVKLDVGENGERSVDICLTDIPAGLPGGSYAATWELTSIPGHCGDGAIASGEECDDNNLDSGDGCSEFCTVESGWSCVGEPSVCT
jgi:cysteine-rich repeat protein